MNREEITAQLNDINDALNLADAKVFKIQLEANQDIAERSQHLRWAITKAARELQSLEGFVRDYTFMNEIKPELVTVGPDVEIKHVGFPLYPRNEVLPQEVKA
jgi:hypothetical protein